MRINKVSKESKTLYGNLEWEEGDVYTEVHFRKSGSMYDIFLATANVILSIVALSSIMFLMFLYMSIISLIVFLLCLACVYCAIKILIDELRQCKIKEETLGVDLYDNKNFKN